jgi:hypothetical protein
MRKSSVTQLISTDTEDVEDHDQQTPHQGTPHPIKSVSRLLLRQRKSSLVE